MNKPPVKSVLLLGAALLTLSACASARVEPPVPAPVSRTDSEKWRDQIKVDGRADEIQLAVHATGVSANQDQALSALVSRWLSAQAREIVVSAPVGGGDAAGGMAVQVRERLVFYGAAPGQVRVVGYDAIGLDRAPLRVGFEIFTAEGPTCGRWENLTATRKNEAYGNFGCAVAANLAAQIANPEDLIRPRDSTPIDAGRRDTVVGKYRKGEVTSSAKDDQANGAISKAIN
ncbi:MAG: pilus assembly protein CpaD [Caulobacter sp. 35-67-4]|nr:MAG: pilus assembly protein CpaD [Caulobacter sp. 32-67-35]OYX96206.1 MAG: pilus assembly protein CpaD [Caulobacter sp. 35-67-4]